MNTLKFPTTLHTNGNGLWSTKKASVKILNLYLRKTAPDWSYADLQVKFDTSTWNIKSNSLIYTDPLFIKELRQFLKNASFNTQCIDYSEQGMQGSNFVSFDVDQKFIDSWIKVFYNNNWRSFIFNESGDGI
jgi:hypothetical protein